MLIKTFVAAGCLLGVACEQVSAQSPMAARPADCAPHPIAPGARDNASPGKGRAGEPLADKLARSDGVVCPPTGIDPDIRAPTPETGTMRVIPPPDSAGGDPSMRPK